jgi:hypothetical protein
MTAPRSEASAMLPRPEGPAYSSNERHQSHPRSREVSTVFPVGHANHPTHEQPRHDDSAAIRFDAVRQWSASRLRHAHRIGAIPLAGSPTWLALDDADPRKTAAVLRAALAWLYESTPTVTVDRLHAELDLIDRCHADRMKVVANDISGSADWSRIAAGPTLRELTRRRNTFPCPDCRTRLRFTDTHCTACGWVEPTPQQRRAAAHRSWAHLDDGHVGEVAA